jgi:HSP20 family protein
MSFLHRTNSDVEPSRSRSALPDPPSWWSSWFDDPAPRVEEHRDDGVMVIRFEMPGIDPERDAEVTLSDGMLRITAERRDETDSDTRGHRSEFRYGSYSRAVALPAGATSADVAATYRDGILEVRIPVDEDTARSKRIPITRA